MKKQEIVTEIEDLLISINEHFTDVENNTRIPNIELDVIAAKLNKLHEKISVYKFINDHEELFRKEKSKPAEGKTAKIEELKNKSFEAPSVPVIETTTEVGVTKMGTIPEIENNSAPVTVNQPLLQEPIKKTTVETPTIEPKPVVSTMNPNSIDVKKFMSINDKLLFQNELFNKNAQDFVSFTEKINSFINFQDATSFFSTLQKQNNWKADDETVLALKKYIHKKFNS